MASPDNQNVDRQLQTTPSEQPTPASPKAPESPVSKRSPSPTAGQKERAPTRTNTAGGMIRRASVTMMNAEPPLGFMAATGGTFAKAPTMGEIRRGSFSHDGWNHEKQVEHDRRRRSSASSSTRGKLNRSGSGFSNASVGRVQRTDTGLSGDAIKEHSTEHEAPGATLLRDDKENASAETDLAAMDTKDYEEAPKLPWTTSWAIGLRAFWKWFLTPLGFCITIYGLNVVAWGGMLFLLLCNASPAMCKPTCNDINSPRRIWIEIDSQILNALFCVTGFGLIPWRFRDLYWLMVYRLGIRGRSKEQRMVGLRRLAGINRGWFRLPDSDKPGHARSAHEGEESDPTVPLPVEKRLDPPLTGVRAPPTALWRLDFVIWCNVWNTFLQACLSGFMWGLNRYNRPSWSTGFFVAMACIAAGMGGIMMWIEGKKVKKVEGVPPKVLQRIGDAERDVIGDGHHAHAHKEKFKEYVPPKEEKHGKVVEQPGPSTAEVK